MLRKTALILALGFAAGGCTHLPNTAGSNPHNGGIMIVVVPREDRVAAAPAPSIDELIRLARLDN